MRVARIISGGQTGADRGGLDAAIDCGIPDGHQLTETASADYRARTLANVQDSDCTLVFTYGPATGGSALTLAYAGEHCKPHVNIDLSLSDDDEHVAQCVLNWMQGGGLSTPDVDPVPPSIVVNVAGSRESKVPGIQERVRTVMRTAMEHLQSVLAAERSTMDPAHCLPPESPKTVAEAVEWLESVMSEGNLNELAGMTERDLLSLHFGLGMFIRNNLHVWSNRPLKDDAGVSHGDDVSAVIIEALWQRLRTGQRRDG